MGECQPRDAPVRIHFVLMQTVLINAMISSLCILMQISRLEHITKTPYMSYLKFEFKFQISKNYSR